MRFRSRRATALLAAGATALTAALAPAAASAQAPQPQSCTTDLSYDASIPTFEQVTGKVLGAGGPGRTARVDSAVIWQYFDAIVAATADHPRVKVVEKPLGTTYLGRKLAYYVIGTKENIDNLDAGRKDGPFWAGVRDGHISEADGLAAVNDRPALAWATETPHGNEPAGAEALARVLYELAARTDCQNLTRLKNIDLFMMPVRNPDGRDNNVRTSAWGFDHNRDFGTRRMKENAVFMPEMNQYPGVFFIDAHQQTSGYFFPPNEDPVHHELSSFTLGFIQDKIGPALQRKFNDQSSQYNNYNRYDMFTPEYGDTVPSFLMGAAGMTYEKGVDEVYGKQVYDHYLAIDETINVTSQSKAQILGDWVEQWQEAIDQGAACTLQPNKLVSPLHTEITQQPDRNTCGYFFRPDSHVGDKAKLFKELLEVGVHLYRLNTPVNAAGVREFGKGAGTQVLPAGTWYIPMAQPMKHWIQAVLGEEPWVPFPYFYDVAAWSYSLQRGLAGDGYLVEQLPAGAGMTEVTSVDLGGAPAAGSSQVYAFNTDSMAGLGLLVDLLDRGATVSRSTEAFTSGGTQFFTGTALVDGASLTGIDLPALAKARQTPVTGLSGYPAPHKAVAKPKIALYTGPSVPQYPLAPGADAATGQCPANSTWCEAMFVLSSKIGVPTSAIVPFTTAQLEAGELVSGNYTAFVNPNGAAIAAGAGATALQTFVNGGGRYVGNGNNALTSGRTAGLTTANTTAIAGMTTAGVELDGTFDTANPVAWGFDRGGWIYRTGSNSTTDPIFDPATLGTGTAAVSYTAGGKAYGYQVGALGAGKLDGRPAVVTQTLGSGVSTFLGFNPYFRAWKEQDDRLVLNAILYPTGVTIPAAPGARESGSKGEAPAAVSEAQALAPAADPVAKADLPAVVSRPATKVANTDRDVRIVIRRAQLTPLKAAVKAAKLSKGLRSKIRYVKAGSRITFVVKGVRTSDEHARKAWVGRLMGELTDRRVKPVIAQL